MLKRLCLPAALLLAASGALAQQPAAQPAPAGQAAAQQPTPEQQQFAQRMVNDAVAVAQSIDQGNIGSVWDRSSDLMKHVVNRDAFVSGVQAQRAKVGKMVSRRLVRVYRVDSKGDQKLPAGSYLNVVFATQFSNEQQPQPELVSYHFDKDNVARLSGYTLSAPTAPQGTSKAH